MKVSNLLRRIEGPRRFALWRNAVSQRTVPETMSPAGLRSDTYGHYDRSVRRLEFYG